MSLNRSRIGERFSRQAEEYDREADLQKEVALRLARSLEPWRLTLPPGPVLEFGAGTGFLTGELLRLLADRQIVATDVSGDMLQIIERSWGDKQALELRQLDAERWQPESEQFALVTGNFVAQWFDDPALALGRIAESLLSDGLLLTAFPGENSFPEWKTLCRELGLPWTANPFPDTEEMVVKLSAGLCQVDYYEEPFRVRFPNALSFFRHLRTIGADTQLKGRKLTPKEFRLLLSEWDRRKGPEGVTITWHLVFLALKRNS